MKKFLALGTIACFLPGLGIAAPTLVGEINIKKPAFLKLYKSSPEADQTLLVSSFEAFGHNAVTEIPMGAQSLLEVGVLSQRTLNDKIVWPNQITEVPDTIFGANHVSIGAGFLVPGHSNGSVQILDVKTGKTFPISKKKNGYFYHRVSWHDMNGDGRLDAVSARAKKPIFGSTDTEIIWLEQPLDPKDNWTEHFIAKGPDVNFVLEDLDQDGQVEIIATEFFSQKLSLHWLEAGRWVSRAVDADIGAAFDLEMTDLNGDGIKDLLVTNHEDLATKAGVFAYEIPADFKTAPWTRHTLLTNITTIVEGKNQASPGTAIAFQPNPGVPLAKPWIVAGGDGSGKVHLLVPDSDATDSWSYQEQILVDTNSTIGGLTVGDIDEDGAMELLVPVYHMDKIMIFSFKEALAR